MRQYASTVLVFAILMILATAVSAQDVCRADFTLSKEGAVLDQDISGFVGLLLKQGYYTVTVYGFASSTDSDPSAAAMTRAEGIADQIAEQSNNLVVAVPQIGIVGGKTAIFGEPKLNERVIVTSDQLFQDQYLPAPSPGYYEDFLCPLVLHCDEVKLHKERWYCMKIEAKDEFWYGPCDHERCIGDTEFKVLSSHKQTELRNVIGDDNESILRKADDLSDRAKLLHESGSHMKSLELYQQAYELYLKIDAEKADNARSARNNIYHYTLKSLEDEDDALELLKIVRRADKITPENPIPMTFEDEDSLGVWLDKAPNITIYIILGLALFAVLIILAHTWHWARHAHLSHKRQFVDEASEEIKTDVEELEVMFKKKMMLADDNIAKIKSLKK